MVSVEGEKTPIKKLQRLKREDTRREDRRGPESKN